MPSVHTPHTPPPRDDYLQRFKSEQSHLPISPLTYIHFILPLLPSIILPSSSLIYYLLSNMAFISTTSFFPTTNLRIAKTCTFSASPTPALRVNSRRAAAAPAIRNSPRMSTYWEGKAPPSTVLGLGQDVPSTLYLLSSVIALGLGSYCVYMSNLVSPLTPQSVNPQFIVGSLLVPISWGL